MSACDTLAPPQSTSTPAPSTPTSTTTPATPTTTAPKPAPTPLPPVSERPVPTPVSARFERTNLTRLPPLADADLIAAWPVWLNACKTLPTNARTRQIPWKSACEATALVDPRNAGAIRAYWVAHFEVWIINPLDASGTTLRGRLTGYYEPELIGSRQRTATYNVPLVRAPADLLTIDLTTALPELAGLRLRGRLADDPTTKRKQVLPYWTREELTQNQNHRLQGLELVWVADPVDAFFLQVQGSGRVKLADGKDKGRIVRLGYADTNGHPYRSIGRWLVEQGELLPEQASLAGIQEWARTHPKRVSEMLNQNPSYVFFRELPLGDANAGPLGALNVALTAGFSVAVDPVYTPLGAPVVLSSTHPGTRAALTRLVFAQDTGSAIRGPARVDLYWGTGRNAGDLAGRSRDEATVWMLLPKGVDPGLIR